MRDDELLLQKVSELFRLLLRGLLGIFTSETM